MTSYTASSRSVFVLGTEAAENREIVIVESGDQYDLDAATITAYTVATTSFPYSV